MYYTAPSSVSQSHNAEWLDGSRNFYFNDLYTGERHLVYQCLKTLLYEKQKQLGMLNPCAEEFIPITHKANINIKKNTKSQGIKISEHKDIERTAKIHHDNKQYKQSQIKTASTEPALNQDQNTIKSTNGTS